MQGLDRYAYVNNSPMNYVDPSGHFTEDAINDYLTNACNGMTYQMDDCGTQLEAVWQADEEWWGMITHAEDGDVLFGTSTCCVIWGGMNTTFTTTFTGVGNTSLMALGGGYSLMNIQQGSNFLGRSDDGEITWGQTFNWVGSYRHMKNGLPDPYNWHLRDGYSKSEDGPPSIITEISDFGVELGAASLIGARCLPNVFTALGCALVGAGASYVVLDTFDIQANDYHYQAGPVYFNFQGNYSNPYSPIYTTEKVVLK